MEKNVAVLKKEKQQILSKRFFLRFAWVCFYSFLHGRAFYMNGINPYILSFCATLYPYPFYFNLSLFVSASSLLLNSSLFESFYYLFALCTMAISQLFLKKNDFDFVKRSLMVSACLFLPLLINVITKEFGLFYILQNTAFLCINLFFTYTLSFSTDLIINKNRSFITQEESISLSLLLAGLLNGIADLHIQYFFLAMILASVFVMFAAYKGGALYGCLSGTLFGYSLLFSGKYSTAFVAVLSLCGLVGGLIKEAGKIFICLGFFVSLFSALFYIDKELINQNMLVSAVTSIMLFLIIPKRYLDQVNILNHQMDEDYLKRLKTKTWQKLHAFAESFKILSKSLKNVHQANERYGLAEAGQIIEQIAEEVCRSCENLNYCWDTNFYQTYQDVFAMLSICDKKGYIDRDDIAKEFKHTCLNLKHFMDVCNYVFDISKNNMQWYNKIQQNKELMADQMHAVSDIITELADDIDLHLSFDTEKEDQLYFELDKIGIKITDVYVLKNNLNRYEVNFKTKSCYGKNYCNEKIQKAVSQAMKIPMKKEQVLCVQNKSSCVLNYIENTKYNVLSGVARASKSESEISGDSYTHTEISKGRFLAAISDGMGSGMKANQESAEIIELLEKLLESGFHEELSVQLINSICLLKSKEDIYSSLDLLSVNLYTGIAEFIKVGASSSYLYRSGSLDNIENHSLPVGSTKDLELHSYLLQLQKNDLLIMCSDGVYDSNLNMWLEGILHSCHQNEPQAIADYLLKIAIHENEEIVKDDMTLLVLKID